MTGKVYFVGAGPGDAELITLKGWKAIEEADVVLYDRLVGSELIDRIRKMGKKLVYVGKKCGESGEKRQAEINRMMLEYAEKGHRVVRLKGGDPLIFGRLSDEIEYLSRRGVEYEVIPGVSSVNGVPAYFGIPLTHPQIATSLVVVAGKGRMSADDLINKSTFVVLMGKDAFRDVAINLIELGVDENKKVAVIQKGTFDDQEIEIMRLGDLKRVKKEFKSPALIVVGDVVEFVLSLRSLQSSTPVSEHSHTNYNHY